MKTFFIILLSASFITFYVKRKEEDNYQKSKPEMKQIVIKESTISKESYNKIQKIYPKISNKISFTLSSNLSEFRIELRNFYTKKQIASNNRLIYELTWNFSDQKNITAWYDATNLAKPVHYKVWDKNAEF